MTKPIGRFHIITDTAIQDRFSHARLAERAIAGGADLIQLRDKGCGTAELVAVAEEVRVACRKTQVPLIINDRPDVALATGADGVHLGRRDLPIPTARRLLGPQAIIGGTASNLDEAIQAQRDGADYIGFGHIYPTSSKNKTGDALGTGPLAEVCRALTIPVIAIGGIDPTNLEAVLACGAWGVAVIAAVCAADDPEQAAQKIRKRIGELL